MSDSVTRWLEQLGLGRYAGAFMENDIDEEVLPTLTDPDLEKLGLTLGHRKKVLQALSSLRSEGSKGPPPEYPTIASRAAETPTDHTTWERLPGERRPVTMLFADITESTSLTESMDAEETHELLYGATRRMSEAVESHRGTVCRFMGDGVMAMFGAPLASEHHAVDACRAASAMQRSVAEYARERGGDAGPLIQIRVGLHSGEVVVLTVGEGEHIEYDAAGPTVPIAARMEQAAAPGTICMTHATHALAEGWIEADPLGAIAVKGISEPLSTFALRRVRSFEEGVARTKLTPFVGRRAELGQLRNGLATSIKEGYGHVVHVRGEAGIGKSRLVEELARIAETLGVACHRGFVSDFGVGKGHDPIQSVVRSLLAIPLGGDERDRELAANRALDEQWLAAEQRIYLNDLLDLPQPPALATLYEAMDNAARNRGKQAVLADLVRRSSARRFLLILMEDVHWAGPVTLAYLGVLAATVASCRALLVTTSRTDGDPFGPSWRSSARDAPLITLDLGPLRAQDSIDLVRELFDAGDPRVQGCLERAAGNPLFLELLLRNLAEGSSETLPDSIHTLVLARIDRLSADERRTLQAASVLGQRFEIDAVRHVSQMSALALEAFVDRNLLRAEGNLHMFAHALIREGVYGSLLKRQRRDLHRRAAEWFASIDAVLHAEHLDHAEDEEAPFAYLEAARGQAAQWRYKHALELTRRGLEICPPARSAALRCLEGELLRNIGSVGDAIDAYRQAVDAAADDAERCLALLGMAEALRMNEQHDELLDVLDRADGIATANDMPAALARICQLRGTVHFMRGESDACLQVNLLSLEHAREARSTELEAQAFGGLGDAEFARRRMISALGYYDRCIGLGREHGLARVVAANLSQRGQTLLYTNELAGAASDCRDAYELAVKIEQPRAEMVAAVVAAYVAAMHDPVAGRRWAGRSLDTARRLGARIFEAISLEYLGRAATEEGDRGEGRRLASEALAILRESQSGMRPNGARTLGALALVSDDPEARLAALEEGETLLRAGVLGHNHLWFYRDAMEVCLDLSRWGQVDQYADAFAACTSTEPLPWSDFFIGRGRALAALGRAPDSIDGRQRVERTRDEAVRIGFKAALPRLERALASP